ncbi:MAG TPA: FAD-dependent oxidoreductase [Candidatus Dormibacteraeota bacterium]|nr:FAD-dependent oxidoreductase [Candidatus Dormibacteraeota bacterium]
MEEYDVVIVGAGPTGLAAAIYTTREDLKTMVLEAEVVGGMIATTEHVDNYPGFPEGIGGIELADNLCKQAKRFGAEIKTGIRVQSIASHEEGVAVTTSGGEFKAKAILLAMGTAYRKLGVLGEKELTGKGVHYCATCDGAFYRGKHLLAIGGGNSALQEGQFLTKFADKVTMLVRGPALKGTQILAEQAVQNPKIDIQFNTAVDSFDSEEGKFTGAAIRNTKTGEVSHIQADGAFVFIGLIPNTGWVKGAVALDERGFVKVDKNFAASQPGVFAAGDIRGGSTGQIASAVGEGVTAAIAIRHHIDSMNRRPAKSPQY